MCVYIYIYIYRYIHTHIHTYVYIYIYIYYVERPRVLTDPQAIGRAVVALETAAQDPVYVRHQNT